MQGVALFLFALCHNFIQTLANGVFCFSHYQLSLFNKEIVFVMLMAFEVSVAENEHPLCTTIMK
jgi:hypothetical protein